MKKNLLLIILVIVFSLDVHSQNSNIRGFVYDKDNVSYPINKKEFSFVINSKLTKFDLIINIIHGSPGEDGEFAKYLKKLIKEALPDASVEIKDLMGDNNHYSATIRSKAFKNLNKIEQHKLVYKSLKGKMGNELHALSIKTEII